VALVVVAGAFWLCAVAMGFALLAICKTAMQVNSIANLGAIVLAGIGGAITPSGSLPAGVGLVAPATPTYWAMRGFGDVILDGGGLGDVALPVTALLGFAGAFFLVAAFRFRLDETKTSWA